MAKKLTAKARDRLIEGIYRQHCTGMQINVMRIGALFAMAGAMLDVGTDHDAIGRAMIDFINGEKP